MPLKNIPDPGFAADDGSADPRLAAALTAYAEAPDAPGAAPRVLAALAGTRVLVPVVALLGESEGLGAPPSKAGGGLRRDKTSDMAVPTLDIPGGRRALPAFTSTAALARWDPAARPVAVPVPQAVRAAVAERADTLVLDVAGPVPYELTGPALLAAAEGRGSTDPLADPAVVAAVTAVVSGVAGVRAASLARAGGADGTLALVPGPGAAPAEVARGVAEALAADATLRARLVRGLDLALLPPDTPLPGEPLPLR
ncbi:SseB family protein [Streptomyces sp. WMMC500]|uniref:SseB family protein n=1 Tax=Streptomyces sp. WMMC500 TaxID=3015154 RepID=UPI00248CCF88|nr:SseB family protein [Streptomyces sp. WMMC500]WBB60368.1 SseB family protein [Streptomyces sp. WMMC500]